MAIDLYYSPVSAPCRFVLLVAASLDLKVNLKLVNLRAGDQLKPEYLKLNPQHAVPTIVDDGFALAESQAISRYLVNKYGKDSTLYPADVQLRALVDQRLDFNLATLYSRFAQYFYPQVFAGAPDDKAQLQKVHDALGFLEAFIDGHVYSVGKHLTIADLGLVTTVSTIEAAGISLKNYPNVLKWYDLVKSTAPQYEEAIESNLIAFRQMAAPVIAKQEL